MSGAGIVRAVTRPLRHDLDLNGVARGDGHLFVRDGVGVAGRGVAGRVDVREVDALLRSVERDDTVGGPGCGALALGCLPFVPGAEATLLVPRVVVGKAADGRRWVTQIYGDGPGGDGLDPTEIDLSPPAPPPTNAIGFTIRTVASPDHYRSAVIAGRAAVRAGGLTKVVLAREVLVVADAPLDVHGILLRLRASFGSSYRYSLDGLIGASPELLVERVGEIVRSHPLAGTAPRTGDASTDAQLAAGLIASVKDQIEHRIVIDVVESTLLPWCSYLDWEADPSIVTVANVQHLGTAMEGRLSLPAPSALDMARALSPTPALGGHPRDAALELIAQVEGFERGRYGGAVGWVDAEGNGTWAVAIRCAELSDDRRQARLVAGCGIVADSDPDKELAETQAKLQAMLSAIVRP